MEKKIGHCAYAKIRQRPQRRRTRASQDADILRQFP